VILERPWDNPASRVTGELTALVGARVMGEHRHPALVEQFTIHRAGGGLKLLRFGGRDGIRTHDLLVANGESLKLRRVATISQLFEKAVNCPTRPTESSRDSSSAVSTPSVRDVGASNTSTLVSPSPGQGAFYLSLNSISTMQECTISAF